MRRLSVARFGMPCSSLGSKMLQDIKAKMCYIAGCSKLTSIEHGVKWASCTHRSVLEVGLSAHLLVSMLKEHVVASSDYYHL